MRKIAIAAALLFLISPRAIADPPPMSPQSFVEQAALDGLLQHAIAQLAGARTHNIDVSRFSKHAIQVFNGANQSLSAAAGDIGRPRALDERRQEQFNSLEAAPQQDFDGLYIALQSEGLDAVHALYVTYSQTGEPGMLRDMATDFVDKTRDLQNALSELKRLRREQKP